MHRENHSPPPSLPPLDPVDAVIADSIAAFVRRVPISESKLFELIAAGHVRTVKIGRRTMIPAAEVRRIAAEIDAGTWLAQDRGAA